MRKNPLHNLVVPDFREKTLQRAKKRSHLSRSNQILSQRYFNGNSFEDFLSLRDAPEENFDLEYEEEEEMDPEDMLLDKQDPHIWYQIIMHQCPRLRCTGVIKHNAEGYLSCSDSTCKVDFSTFKGNFDDLEVENFVKRLGESFKSHEGFGCDGNLAIVWQGDIGVYCQKCGFSMKN